MAFFPFTHNARNRKLQFFQALSEKEGELYDPNEVDEGEACDDKKMVPKKRRYDLAKMVERNILFLSTD